MRNLGIVSLILFMSAFATGQQNPISSLEYNSALEAARVKLVSRNHRTIDVHKSYSKKLLSETTTTITESIPPDHHRYQYTTEKNGLVTRYETIRIGTFIYTKDGDKDWEKIDLNEKKGRGSGTGSGSGVAVQTKTLTSFLLNKTTLDKQPCLLYFKYIVIEAAGNLSFVDSRDWVSTDGLPIKSMSKRSFVTPENIIYSTEINHEYDPKDLKIEAPIK